MRLDPGVDLSEIAAMTEGKNGADLKAICMEAGMFAIRRDRDAVSKEDFCDAIEKIGLDFERHLYKSGYGAMFA